MLGYSFKRTHLLSLQPFALGSSLSVYAHFDKYVYMGILFYVNVFVLATSGFYDSKLTNNLCKWQLKWRKA